MSEDFTDAELRYIDSLRGEQKIKSKEKAETTLQIDESDFSNAEIKYLKSLKEKK